MAERAGRSLVALPVGATEQHGLHLPVATDTLVATALCERLAQRRDDVLVAPPIAYGSSGEHASFPGTLSIGVAVTTMVLVELVRSADVFRGTVIVCGHGGNAESVADAVAVLRAEGRAVLAWFPSVAGGDAHAGRTETSLLLALAADSVRLGAAEPGNPRPLAELLPVLRARGVAAASPNGVLGDPTGASADEGRALLELLTEQLLGAVAARWPD